MLAPREIIRVLNCRKVLRRADLTAGDEGLDGEPTQVRRGGLDLRSQLTCVSSSSSRRNITSNKSPSADARSASASLATRRPRPVRLADHHRWGCRREDRRRTGQRHRVPCVAATTASTVSTASKRRSRASPDEQGESSGRASPAAAPDRVSAAGVVNPVICVRETDGGWRMRLPTRTRQTILHPSVGQSSQAPNDSKGERRTYSPSMVDLPYDAILLVSFGGPEGPDDVIAFLENVTRGRGGRTNGSPRSVSTTPTSVG